MRTVVNTSRVLAALVVLASGHLAAGARRPTRTTPQHVRDVPGSTRAYFEENCGQTDPCAHMRGSHWLNFLGGLFARLESMYKVNLMPVTQLQSTN